jgi:hypothetical protein
MLLSVQVLEQLPEELAIAVLTASQCGLNHLLSVLPASLHPLAIESAFPSIRHSQSLAFDFDS